MSFVAYDCGTRNLNITTTSLLDIGRCKIPQEKPIIEEIHVQLLQLADYHNIHVIQCKVEIDRTIYYCGMHSHVSVVANGRMSYIQETTESQCSKMQLWKGFSMAQGTVISGLRPNQTITRGITLAGHISNDGACKGTQYSDPYGTWADVVVQAVIKISLRDYYATVKDDRVILSSGTQCHLAEGNCMDIEGGNTFWAPMPIDNCKFHQYDVLYEGNANRIYDNTTNNENVQEVYSITSDEITFALSKKGQKEVCGYTLIRTEHPKLFILAVPKGKAFLSQKLISASNLDIFAYVNSKFVYLEKHVKNQMTALYRDVLTQRCALEREVLKNALTLAALVPDEFAYHIMRGPGYMAVTMGEVIHIIKCIPVDIKIRRTKECYLQLPVFHGNRSMFISPRSHMIMKTGTEVDCNPLIPPMYRIEGTWFKFLPHPTEAIEPQEMQPVTESKWKYSNPVNLATSGIYATRDLEKLRDHIMFPAERPSILSTIARRALGEEIKNQGISMTHLLDEKAIEAIANSTWNHMWGWFTGFGTFSAGLMGIWITAKFVKFLMDTIIHGYALHSVFGCSIYLLGAIWDSLTNLLLHLRDSLLKPHENEIEMTKTMETQERNTELAHSATTSIYPNIASAPQYSETATEVHVSPEPHELRYSVE